jgi:hypothetical protein
MEGDGAYAWLARRGTESGVYSSGLRVIPIRHGGLDRLVTCSWVSSDVCTEI